MEGIHAPEAQQITIVLVRLCEGKTTEDLI